MFGHRLLQGIGLNVVEVGDLVDDPFPTDGYGHWTYTFIHTEEVLVFCKLGGRGERKRMGEKYNKYLFNTYNPKQIEILINHSLIKKCLSVLIEYYYHR